MCRQVPKLICGFDTHNTGVYLIKDGFPVMGEPSYFFLLVICVTRTHVFPQKSCRNALHCGNSNCSSVFFLLERENQARCTKAGAGELF